MAELTDDEYLASHPEHRELDPAIRAQLRQNAQLTADLESERTSRTQLERRAAFAEAGLSDLPHRELFEKSYEGEMTAEAIKTEAAKYGLVTEPAATTAPSNRADLDAIRRTQQASQGAPTTAPMDFGEALDRARSQEEWNEVMANAPAESGVRLARTHQGYRIV